jgi:hypothetical protein
VEFLIAFTHVNLEEFRFSPALWCKSDAVLGNTYRRPVGSFAPLKACSGGHRISG